MISNIARGLTSFTSNAFLVPGERTVLVDAGNDFDAVTRIRERTGGLDAVVMTHTHPDHVGNLPAVKEAFGVDAWGFDTGQPGVDHAIEDEEAIPMGEHEYLALHTPGHKNDHLCFYASGPGILFTGDLVFANGGFGRTDLAEGDPRQLLESIDRVLATVNEDLREMHTGHGPSVTNRPYDHLGLARQAAGFG